MYLPMFFFKAREASLRAAGALGRHSHRLGAAQRWAAADARRRWDLGHFPQQTVKQPEGYIRQSEIMYIYIYRYIFKGLRLTAGRRPSNDVWRMVWEDWAEMLCANPGRAMLN